MRYASIPFLKFSISKSFNVENIKVLFDLLPKDSHLVETFIDVYDMCYLVVQSSEFVDSPNTYPVPKLPQIVVVLSSNRIDYINMYDALDPAVTSRASVAKAKNLAGLPSVAEISKASVPPLNCYYPVWKMYKGFIDSYEYCTTCGKKKGEHL